MKSSGSADRPRLLEERRLRGKRLGLTIPPVLNGQHVKLVKFDGEFIRHRHETEDGLFLVLQGQFDMQFRDRVLSLNESELIIVPRGVEHQPVADESRSQERSASQRRLDREAT